MWLLLTRIDAAMPSSAPFLHLNHPLTTAGLAGKGPGLPFKMRLSEPSPIHKALNKCVVGPSNRCGSDIDTNNPHGRTRSRQRSLYGNSTADLPGDMSLRGFS